MKTGKSIILAAAIGILLAATGPWAEPPTAPLQGFAGGKIRMLAKVGQIRLLQ